MILYLGVVPLPLHIYFYFSCPMSLGETIIVYGLGGYFYVYPSVACVALIYLHARAAFSVPACCLFSQCMLAIIPLIGDLSSLHG